MAKVFDACIFFDELDMLETRMRILDPVVDYFVVCEAGETHSGKPKPYHFAENQARFADFEDKIILVQVDNLTGPGRNSWERERYHRSRIADGLIGAKSDDWIIVGDCDEMADPDTVARVVRNGVDGAMLELAFYYYDLHHRVSQGWAIGMMRWGVEYDPNKIRTGEGHSFPHWNHGGWHCSYFGGPQAVVDKVDAFMHHNDPIIRDMPRDPVWVADQMAAGQDLFGRNLPIVEVLGSTRPDLPRYVVDHPDQYRAWGWIR